jgi:hypothetical protein
MPLVVGLSSAYHYVDREGSLMNCPQNPLLERVLQLLTNGSRNDLQQIALSRSVCRVIAGRPIRALCLLGEVIFSRKESSDGTDEA